MTSLKRLLAVVAIAATVASCSNSSSNSSGPTTGFTPSVPTASDQMIVNIDGTTHTMVCFAFRLVLFDTAILAAGVDLGGKGVGVSLNAYNSPGTYDIGVTDTSGGRLRFALATYSYAASSTDTVEYAPPTEFPGTSHGKFHVTLLTDSLIQGTFTATLPKQKGIAGGPTVTIAGGLNAHIQ